MKGKLQHPLLTISLFLIFNITSAAQKVDLTYYLPDINYEKDIPAPESFLGYQIGEWHISHDQQLMYMRTLAAASPRVVLTEYGKSHEGRPLVYLTITSQKNHKKLEEIKAEHLKLSDPESSESVDISKLPAVLYQGFSIHGNEASGGNAAPLVAYYLAAGKNKEVERILDDVIILLDPCFNPDGFNRFASWANTHKNKNLTADPQDIEYNEPWPRGRTNHYWFDLNRDWLPVQHPESQGRINLFHDWKPNVLTDHHEMGSNSTFFFMPGEPTRINPHTPKRNQELTAEIGTHHAAALDAIGSLYYTGENFDDFYIGKGSTYPDVNGCIGILFEQASSRGHLQETTNGLLTFPFTIRNQVTTAISTLKATKTLRKELNEYQRQFYADAIQQAQNDETKAFVFAAPKDASRVDHLIEMMRRHKIEVYELSRDLNINGNQFSKSASYIVPLEQPQYRLIKAMFDTRTSFVDSIFYDISAWSMQYAFNLDFASLNKRDFNQGDIGNPIENLQPERELLEPEFSDYAYLMKWDDFYAPKALNYILNKNLRVKVATSAFTNSYGAFEAGTIMIPVQNQDNKSAEDIHKIISEAALSTGIKFYDQDTGLTPTGIDMGSGNFRLLEKANVLLLSGSGTSSYSVGAIWHLLDQRYDIVVTMVNADQVDRTNLDKYNVIILGDGNYSTILPGTISKIKGWVAKGGTLVTIAGGADWTIKKGISNARKRNNHKKDTGRKPYASMRRNNGGNVIGGAIVEQYADISHPLLFGYNKSTLPTFRRGTFFMEAAKNPYATPLIYGNDSLKAGYVNSKNQKQMANSAGIVVSGTGRGKVINIADDPTFRAFWYGTAKIMANAIFFGQVIDSGSTERSGSNE